MKRNIVILALIGILLSVVGIFFSLSAGATTEEEANPSLPFLSFSFCESPGVQADYTFAPPASTSGVTFTVAGKPFVSTIILAPGESVTMVATAAEGYVFPTDPEQLTPGYQVNKDGTLSVTFDTSTLMIDCEVKTPETVAPLPTVEVVSTPTVEPTPEVSLIEPAVVEEIAVTQPETLANTGANAWQLFWLAIMCLLAGIGLERFFRAKR